MSFHQVKIYCPEHCGELLLHNTCIQHIRKNWKYSDYATYKIIISARFHISLNLPCTINKCDRKHWSWFGTK